MLEMTMPNWLNIAGGAAQGYVQGDEDNRRRREFEALQRQRLRVESEQKQDDALAEQLKNVRGAGTYEEDTGDTAAGVTTGPSAVGVPGRATTKTKVTAADADRQRADILSRGGRLKDLQAGATFRQNALATEAAERTERRAQDEDVILKAGRLNSVPGGQVAAVRHLAEAYKQVPDGHQLVVEDRNGVPHVGVSGPDGKYVQQPVPITKEVVDGFIKKGMEMTSVQAAQKGQELGIHQQTADSGRIAAEAAQRNADTAAKETYWKTIGEGGTVALAKQKAEAAAAQAHANYYNAAAAHVGDSANAAKFGQSVPFSDGKGGTVYMTPVRNPKTGQIDWQRENMPEGLTPFKQPQQLSDMQKELLKVHQKKVEAGAFKTPVEEEAALTAIIGPGGGAGGGFFDTLNKGDPSKQMGPPTPTAAEKATANPKPKRAETKEEAEARRQKEKFLKRGPIAQITPQELNAQLEAQVQAANRR